MNPRTDQIIRVVGVPVCDSGDDVFFDFASPQIIEDRVGITAPGFAQ
jgi:hypothetical protein